MLLRGADDGRGAAHGERAHLPGAGALHDQSRRRRRDPRQRRIPAAAGTDPRQDPPGRQVRADRRRPDGAGGRARLRRRVRVDARGRRPVVRVPGARREHAGHDVLHHRHDRPAQGRLLQPSPARAAYAGGDAGLRACATRDIHGARRLHADHADVPRPRLGAALRRHAARREAGVSGALCARRAAGPHRA